MAQNLGIGGPPKKRGVPPPPFGGGDRGGSAAKAAPAFAPKGGADAIGAAVEEAPPPAPAKAPAAGGDIPPEAVCYRSEAETCGACTYNEGGECSKLSIPVSDGDGCNLFMDRGGQDLEASEELAEPAEPVVDTA